MKKVKAQLKVLSKNLVSLSKQVDKISKQVDKMQPAAKPTVKRKPATKRKPAAKRKPVAKRKPAAKRKPVAKRKPAAKKTAAAAPKRVVKRTGAATTRTRATRGSTVLDSVFNAIKRNKKGVNIAQLKARTGLDPRQLSNALYKLSKKGTILAKSRGLYVAK